MKSSGPHRPLEIAAFFSRSTAEITIVLTRLRSE
jgi:hypothetical protein